MVSLLTPTSLSPEHYLAQEETAITKSEYRNGTLIPMTGGSINHNRIIRNLIRHLDRLLTPSNASPKPASAPAPYEVFCNDLRVWIPAHNHYTYPDFLILDQPPEFHGDRTDTILNPSLIIEVLSQSTSSYDRGDKFTHYRTLPSLKEYILIDQYRIHIEQFSRTPQGQWLLQESTDPQATLSFQSVPAQIPHALIYDRVTFTT